MIDSLCLLDTTSFHRIRLRFLRNSKVIPRFSFRKYRYWWCRTRRGPFTNRKGCLQSGKPTLFYFLPLQLLAHKTTMALDSYFATLKLQTGVQRLSVVQDRAVTAPAKATTPPPSKTKDLRSSLKDTMRTAATKFSIDECDEPLYCPKRQLSSSTDNLSGSQRSSEGLELDDSYRYQWESSWWFTSVRTKQKHQAQRTETVSRWSDPRTRAHNAMGKQTLETQCLPLWSSINKRNRLFLTRRTITCGAVLARGIMAYNSPVLATRCQKLIINCR